MIENMVIMFLLLVFTQIAAEQTGIQRYLNKLGRYKKPAYVVAGGLAAGFLGKKAWDYFSEKERIKQVEELRKYTEKIGQLAEWQKSTAELIKSILLESHRLYQADEKNCIQLTLNSGLMQTRWNEDDIKAQLKEKNDDKAVFLHTATDCRLSKKLLKDHAQLAEEQLYKSMLLAVKKIITELSEEHDWFLEKSPVLTKDEQNFVALWQNEIVGQKGGRGLGFESLQESLNQKKTIRDLLRKAKKCYAILKSEDFLTGENKTELEDHLKNLSDYFLYARAISADGKDMVALGDTEETGIMQPIFDALGKDQLSIGLGDYTDRWWNGIPDVCAITQAILKGKGYFVSGNHERSAYAHYSNGLPNVNNVFEYFIEKNPYITNQKIKDKMGYLRRLLMVLLPSEIYDKKSNTIFVHGAPCFAFPLQSFIDSGKSFYSIIPHYVKDGLIAVDHGAAKSLYRTIEPTKNEVENFYRAAIKKDPRNAEYYEKQIPKSNSEAIQKILDMYSDIGIHITSWCDLKDVLGFELGRGAHMIPGFLQKLLEDSYTNPPSVLRAHQHTGQSVAFIIKECAVGKMPAMVEDKDTRKCSEIAQPYYTMPLACSWTGCRIKAQMPEVLDGLDPHLLHIAALQEEHAKTWRPVYFASDENLENVKMKEFKSQSAAQPAQSDQIQV